MTLRYGLTLEDRVKRLESYPCLKSVHLRLLGILKCLQSPVEPRPLPVGARLKRSNCFDGLVEPSPRPNVTSMELRVVNSAAGPFSDRNPIAKYSSGFSISARHTAQRRSCGALRFRTSFQRAIAFSASGCRQKCAAWNDRSLYLSNGSRLFDTNGPKEITSSPSEVTSPQSEHLVLPRMSNAINTFPRRRSGPSGHDPTATKSRPLIATPESYPVMYLPDAQKRTNCPRYPTATNCFGRGSEHLKIIQRWRRVADKPKRVRVGVGGTLELEMLS
jgi:hypothetical protein